MIVAVPTILVFPIFLAALVPRSIVFLIIVLTAVHERGVNRHLHVDRARPSIGFQEVVTLGHTVVEDGFGEWADGVAGNGSFAFEAGLLPRQLTTSTMLLL
ncbi:hypothetical protein A4H34_03335 [Peptidiphaga gingivicola]|uniref:Uncharacterized protein n=1 Tax=Peptidiphaga gingivicola TaxID=2741497 RepID=A0A179B3E2_9ACTO|nr:hypothetical protein A4H34_03335 [Peptidiphaga gingivicola]